MNDASEALADVGDLGFVVFRLDSENGLEIAASNIDEAAVNLPDMSTDDPFHRWMQSALGTSDLSEVQKVSPFLKALKRTGSPIGLAGFSETHKILTLMYRSNDQLHQKRTAEAFASSYALAANPAVLPTTEPSPKVAAYLNKVIDGHDDQEIADELDLSLRAIKERKKKTIEEFDAKTMTHAVAKSVKSS